MKLKIVALDIPHKKGIMRVNFAKNLTDKERDAELKKYRTFYKGTKIKVIRL